jgi:hypothetical protein
MKMLKKMLLGCLAAALLLGSLASNAQASSVLNDSGNFSSFTLTNTGGGVFTLAITAPDTLTDINGLPVSIPATFDSVLTFKATTSGSLVVVSDVSPVPFTKTFGTGTDIASLTYSLSAGQIGAGINSNGLLLAGRILTVSPNALPGFDFTPLVGGVNSFALTGQSYTGGVSSMAGVFAVSGASVTGSGGFSESSNVPEPASLALLGIGMTGLLAFRRFFKKTSVA